MASHLSKPCTSERPRARRNAPRMFQRFRHRSAPCTHACTYVIGCSLWPETPSRFTSALNCRPPVLSSCQAGRETVLCLSGGWAASGRGSYGGFSVWMQVIQDMDYECAQCQDVQAKCGFGSFSLVGRGHRWEWQNWFLVAEIWQNCLAWCEIQSSVWALPIEESDDVLFEWKDEKRADGQPDGKIARWMIHDGWIAAVQVFYPWALSSYSDFTFSGWWLTQSSESTVLTPSPPPSNQQFDGQCKCRATEFNHFTPEYFKLMLD